MIFLHCYDIIIVVLCCRPSAKYFERKMQMTKKTANTIRLIYGCLLSVLLVVTGVLLMIECVNVYNIGTRPFTPENISAAFGKIAIPVYITIGAVIIGIILKIALPEDKGKVKAIFDQKSVLARLEKKVVMPEGNCSGCPIRKEKIMRLIARLIVLVISLRSGAFALEYVLNFENFTMDYNACIKLACIWVFAATIVVMGACIALVYFEEASYKRQIKAVKSLIAKGHVATPAAKEETIETKKAKVPVALIVRLSILAVAIVFIILGAFNGGMADVLSKAINICTECIGLG